MCKTQTHTYVEPSGAVDRLRAPTAEHGEGSFLRLGTLFKTQTEDFSGQVDVPVGRMLLDEIIYHPVDGEAAIRKAETLTGNMMHIFRLLKLRDGNACDGLYYNDFLFFFFSEHKHKLSQSTHILSCDSKTSETAIIARPVNQLLRGQICGACLLMMDNQGDGDLQPVFQFSVDLAQGHISVRHNAMTRVTKQKVQRVGSCAPIKLLASVRHIIVLLGENSSQRIYSFSL